MKRGVSNCHILRCRGGVCNSKTVLSRPKLYWSKDELSPTCIIMSIPNMRPLTHRLLRLQISTNMSLWNSWQNTARLTKESPTDPKLYSRKQRERTVNDQAA